MIFDTGSGNLILPTTKCTSDGCQQLYEQVCQLPSKASEPGVKREPCGVRICRDSSSFAHRHGALESHSKTITIDNQTQARCARHKKYVPEQSSTSKEALQRTSSLACVALENSSLKCHWLRVFLSLPAATCR